MRTTIRWDGTSPITVTDIEKTCSGCPAQWEGRTAHGDNIYFRYRWGGFSVALWANDDGDGWTDIYESEDGNGSSFLDFSELKEITPDWITLPVSEYQEELP